MTYSTKFTQATDGRWLPRVYRLTEGDNPRLVARCDNHRHWTKITARHCAALMVSGLSRSNPDPDVTDPTEWRNQCQESPGTGTTTGTGGSEPAPNAAGKDGSGPISDSALSEEITTPSLNAGDVRRNELESDEQERLRLASQFDTGR